MGLETKFMQSLKPSGPTPRDNLSKHVSLGRRPIPINTSSLLPKPRRNTRTTRATTPESPILIQDGDNGNEGEEVSVRVVPAEREKSGTESDSVKAAKAVGATRTHKSASQYLSFELVKFTVITSYSKEVSVTDPIMEVFFRSSKMNILSNDPALNVQIPYHSVKIFKLPRPSSGKRLVTVLLELRNEIEQKIKGKAYPVEKIVLHFRKVLDFRQVKQIKAFIGEDCLYSHFDSQELIRYFELLAFEPTKSEKFYGSAKFTASPVPSMKTDFSSLDRRERRERSHRIGSQIKYKNEESEDEKATEQMVYENGETMINDYISSDDQLILEPDLKYKFDNKKTFTITNDDFKCLYNGNWINDTLVDFFLSYYLKLAREKKIPKANNIEVLNSFFFTSLSRPIENDDYYQNVKSWFKMNDTLFDRDYVIIPIMQDLHWYFVIITDLKLLKRKHMKAAAENGENSEKVNLGSKIKREVKEETQTGDSLCIPDSNPDIQSTYQDTQTSVLDDTQSQIEANETLDSPQQSSSIGSAKNSSSVLDGLDSDTNDQIKQDNADGDANGEASSTAVPEDKLVGVARICILDSLRRNHEKAIGYLKSFIISYAAEKYNFEVKSNEIAKQVCFVPQQKNFNDCGLHLVFNVETMLTDPIKFGKIILKKHRNRRNVYKTRKENEQIFDSKKRLSLREDLRELLLKLLKDQVVASGEDASKIGVITAKEKRLQELKHSDGANSIPKKSDTSGNITNSGDEKRKRSSSDDSKTGSEVSDSGKHGRGENSNDVKDEEDDDLVIVHANDKEPIKPDLELAQVLPSNETLSPKPSVDSPKPKVKRGRKKKEFVIKIRTSPVNMNKNPVNGSILKNEDSGIRHFDDNDSDTLSLMEESSRVSKKKPFSSGSMIKSRRPKRTIKLKSLKKELSSESEPDVDVEDSQDKDFSGRSLRTYRVRRKQSKPADEISESQNSTIIKSDILSQDSYRTKIVDDSPIKLLESDCEQTDIGAEIDRELQSESQSVSATSSQPTTSSKKLIDLVDVELNTSRCNTPVSPIKLRSDKVESELVNGENILGSATGKVKPKTETRQKGKLTARLVQAAKNSDDDSYVNVIGPEAGGTGGGEQINLRLTTKLRDPRKGVDPSNAIAIDDDTFPRKEGQLFALDVPRRSKDLSDISPIRIRRVQVHKIPREITNEEKKDEGENSSVTVTVKNDTAAVKLKSEIIVERKEPDLREISRTIFKKKPIGTKTSPKLSSVPKFKPETAQPAATLTVMPKLHAPEPKKVALLPKPPKRSIDSVDLTSELQSNKKRANSRSASPMDLIERRSSSYSPLQRERSNGENVSGRKRFKNVMPTDRRLRSMSPRTQQGIELTNTEINSLSANSQNRTKSRTGRSSDGVAKKQIQRGATMGTDIIKPQSTSGTSFRQAVNSQPNNKNTRQRKN